jgi:nicotinate-nucleotide adenylyltransferase
MSRADRSLRLGFMKARTPLALPGQRIGLMGGSFNPPHRGHVAVSETAIRRLRLDRMWWVVTPRNPLKRGADLPPLAERMAACRSLVSNPKIEITGFEAELGSHYTAHTLAFLRKRHRLARFVWVMGADNLAHFHEWRDWRSIAKCVPLAVIDRPGWRLKALASPAARALARRRVAESRAAMLVDRRPPAWIYIATRLSGLSSTAIRAHQPS